MIIIKRVSGAQGGREHRALYNNTNNSLCLSVHRLGILEGVPDDNRGSALCRAGFIGGEYLKEYLMTIGGVLCVVQGSSAGNT